MCFLPRIFNYGIICSHNRTFLDSRRQNKNYCVSLLIAAAVTDSLTSDLPASLLDLNCSLVWPRPACGLWLVSRPALTDPGRQPEVQRILQPGGLGSSCRSNSPCAPDTPGEAGRGHWFTRLGLISH